MMEYRHKDGRCNINCVFYDVTESEDTCELTGQQVMNEETDCAPYLSDQHKQKAAEEEHCPRCGLTKAELPDWERV